MAELTLEDLCELVVDCKNRTPPETTSPAPYGHAIGTPHIKDGRISLVDAKPVDEETFKTWTARAVPRAGDIVLTREAPVGRVARIDEGMRICLGQRTMLLRAQSGKTDSRFLHYFLLSPRMQEIVHGRASGSTVPHLRVEQVRSLPVRGIPNLRVQRDIGEVLGALDDKIAVNERIAAVTDVLGIALTTRLASHSTNESRLSDVIELRYGKSLTASQRSAGDVPVFGSGGLAGWHDTPLVKGPGIVVGRKGTVGSIYWSQADFFPIDTTFYVSLKSPDLALEYLYFAMRNLGLEDMNSDSAVPGLNRDRALSLKLRIPTGAEAARASEQLKSFFARRHAIEAESRALAELRDTLLPKLMSGQLTIRQAEELTEEAT